jgi:hypothetical protein
MDESRILRLRLLQRFEQLAQSLADNDPSAERDARTYLARIVSRGSIGVLAQVYRGIVLGMDDTADWSPMT